MPRGREGASARAGWRPAERCERSSRPFSAHVSSPHPTTLQHHRRPNVTATVTRIVLWAEQGRHSGIHATTVKRCMLASSKPGADFSRGCASCKTTAYFSDPPPTSYLADRSAQYCTVGGFDYNRSARTIRRFSKV